MATLAKTASKDPIKDIIYSNLLLGLDGALERILIQLSEFYKTPILYLTNIQCKKIVQILDEYDIFLLRDSVNTLATILPISRVSIYKYLRK